MAGTVIDKPVDVATVAVFIVKIWSDIPADFKMKFLMDPAEAAATVNPMSVTLYVSLTAVKRNEAIFGEVFPTMSLVARSELVTAAADNDP